MKASSPTNYTSQSTKPHCSVCQQKTQHSLLGELEIADQAAVGKIMYGKTT